MLEAQHHICELYLNEKLITYNSSTYKKFSWYQLNFMVSLVTRETGVGGKDMKSYLGLLYLYWGKTSTRNHVLKVVDNKIGSIIQNLYHEWINKK